MLNELFPGFALLVVLAVYAVMFLVLQIAVKFAASRVTHSVASLFITFRLFHHVGASLLLAVLLVLLDQAVVEFALLNTTVGLRIVQALLVVFVSLMVVRILNALQTAFLRSGYVHKYPVRGYFQLATIAVYCLGVLLIIVVLSGQPIGYYLGGIGALLVVFLLIFQNTILSIVSALQIQSDKLIQVGDWIEVPNYNADGNVIDIALYTVKVQNWDKTIVSIPTREITNVAMVNWQGMEEAGGRRIKRAIMVDMSSVRFLTTEEIEEFSRFKPLRKYMADILGDIEAYNAKYEQTTSDEIGDPRRLTNLGTLRAYMVNYLKSHPKLDTTNFICMVRQLEPTSTGIPLEIYTFLRGTDWVEYETVQADIFDHLLVMVNRFDIRVYQEGLLEALAVEGVTLYKGNQKK